MVRRVLGSPAAALRLLRRAAPLNAPWKRRRLIRVNRTCAFRRAQLPSFEMTRTIDIQTPMGVLAARSGSAI
jgi:hypothetical protein